MRHIGIVIVFFLAFNTTYSSEPIDFKENFANVSLVYKGFTKPFVVFNQNSGFEETPEHYSLISKNTLSQNTRIQYFNKINALRKHLTISFNGSFFIESWSIVQNSFSTHKTTVEKYTPEFSPLSLIYLYVSLIGFYIAIMINLNKKTERAAKILISSFVFIHSFFIFHICFNLTNYHFVFPHSYRMSTIFSFLYGPLLYFYYKRITQQYEFRKRDLFHLVPTILLIAYLIPTYSLPLDYKLNILLERKIGIENSVEAFQTSGIVVTKLLSLVVYGYFIRGLYLKSKESKSLKPENRIWQRNIYYIHFFYIIAYAIYGILISNNISSGIFYHFQVACMATMVMYIGYSANVQPAVFNGSIVFNQLFYKYEKSGLTKSLSIELKENLLHLLHNEKVYKESSISLDTLSEKLNTTRHNTSQVINEHFKMSFHELVNTYRIKEAKEILNSDRQKNLNIIDIAYEVGYNNKVTFNKAFKKNTQLTPSQYQKIAFNSYRYMS